MARTRKLDDLMEAVTFAEAGETEHAGRLAREIFPDRSRRGHILVVGAAPGFSARIIAESLAMAERLEYGLVALTVEPVLARWMPRMPGRGRVRGGRLPPEAFRARAAERAIPFVHLTRAGDPERAVAAVTRRFRRIAFLLVDDGPRTARFADVGLPIFLVAGR